MQIINQILSSKYFNEQPPVLIDIGASGAINAKWEKIAPFSICIAFDADDREFSVSETVSSGYKKLITINRIVTAEETAAADFYLTRSPFCSSLLRPRLEKLEPWAFKSLFEVDKKIQLQATTVSKALEQAGIQYIDWFKTDTQGTDLRLFNSVQPHIRENILAAEFEPGIMDAYEGEDKLFAVMQTMQQKAFWLSAIEVKGTQRFHEKYQQQFGEFNAHRMVRKSPCWAEVTYLHQPNFVNARQLLLLIVFAIIEKQYGFVLEICEAGEKNTGENIFEETRKAIMKQLNKEKMKLPLVIMKKQFNKLFAHINA